MATATVSRAKRPKRNEQPVRIDPDADYPVAVFRSLIGAGDRRWRSLKRLGLTVIQDSPGHYYVRGRDWHEFLERRAKEQRKAAG